ncbi:DUF418 domain-containing protein [Oceanobacillus neutriphilus]|uniref:DUF418 domain-containing protein n=1 Tax=Oceanobacillus neutriphilus TaxID=531815 RepID=A0ABQ2NQZ6_9BACI|nr:DUF418 domain-containing protein [Oceanobacillus neutriphilus]GGP09614.1 hypothetical protein GCM10011346_14460 [Oceanobacillus neutriphilus]
MQPYQVNKRLEWIDAARGFAILGIFMVNIGSFSAPYFLYGGAEDTWTAGIDQFSLAFIDIFFQASFYTLFSILFGFGIQNQKDSLDKKDISPYAFFGRRLGTLIVFGIIHAFAVWNGDILLTYGTMGFLLLLFLNSGDKTLAGWGFGLLGFSTIAFTSLQYAARDFIVLGNTSEIEQAFQSYRSSDFSIIMAQNFQDWQLSNGILGFFIYPFIILPLFLFGMYLARKRWFHDPLSYSGILKKIWIISLIVFILFKIGPYLFGNPLWFALVQDNIGGTASAVFYLTSITLLWQKGISRKILRVLAPIGKMALSNYLLQSVISFWLFYGVGVGLYGEVRPFQQILIVLIIFCLQIIGSTIWLRYFQFGPVEWLWRCITYKKMQPFRR